MDNEGRYTWNDYLENIKPRSRSVKTIVQQGVWLDLGVTSDSLYAMLKINKRCPNNLLVLGKSKQQRDEVQRFLAAILMRTYQKGGVQTGFIDSSNSGYKSLWKDRSLTALQKAYRVDADEEWGNIFKALKRVDVLAEERNAMLRRADSKTIYDYNAANETTLAPIFIFIDELPPSGHSANEGWTMSLLNKILAIGRTAAVYLCMSLSDIANIKEYSRGYFNYVLSTESGMDMAKDFLQVCVETDYVAEEYKVCVQSNQKPEEAAQVKVPYITDEEMKELKENYDANREQ